MNDLESHGALGRTAGEVPRNGIYEFTAVSNGGFQRLGQFDVAPQPVPESLRRVCFGPEFFQDGPAHELQVKRQMAHNAFAGAGVPSAFRIIQQSRLRQAVGLQQLALGFQFRQRGVGDNTAVAGCPTLRQPGFNLPLGKAGEIVNRGTAVKYLLLQKQQRLVAGVLVYLARNCLQGMLVFGYALVLRERICGGLEDGLCPLPQGRCRARRFGGRKTQEPVPRVTKGLQSVRINALGKSTVGLRQPRRFIAQPFQASSDFIQTRLQLRLEPLNGRPRFGLCSIGSLAKRLPLYHRGTEQCLRLLGGQGLKGFVPHLSQRAEERPQRVSVRELELRAEALPAAGVHDVERLGDGIVQLGGFFLGPCQLVISQARAGFVELQRRPGGAADVGNRHRGGSAVPMQVIDCSPDARPGLAEI